MDKQVVRIGCGSGFWGDTPEGTRQLVERGALDYLMLDYLAEVTMSILARMRSRNPALGYVPDFVTQVIRLHGRDIARQGIKVVVNAGGVNPAACKAAVEKELAEQGLALKVAAVVGDDLLASGADLRARDVREMFSGEALPQSLVSANAYLGAFPIAAALAGGADVVVTGRCVDSALALGPLIHAFGWLPEQYDLLSAGSLAGHVIECGPQCTGGFFSDWRQMQHGWADIGFPIAECSADGSVVITKPAGTGGGVTRATVAEQITYETGDPRRYLLPDVSCDWSEVQLREDGPDRVAVSGARGLAPGPCYKVSATYLDGHRCIATLLVRGRHAVDKARGIAHAMLARCSQSLERERLAPFTETSVELLGAEDAYGPRAQTLRTREVVLKIAARHPLARALDIFAGEIFPASTGTVQGISGAHAGKPKVQPVVRLFSFLHDKDSVPVSVCADGAPTPVVAHRPAAGQERAQQADKVRDELTPAMCAEPTVKTALSAVAHARSGDKGDMSNIAVLARHPKALPLLRAQVTPARVQDYFAHLVQGNVQRFDWPGLDGMNFLLDQALGGGGVASLRYDPQGKAYAEMLLDLQIDIPVSWFDEEWVQA